ncbi:hypothetical protein BV25DRAFT_1837564 [Artomyces pyxidatus]|uniref:Uncharacterized protein n=1 Tax=Artomyces pyxidatus TaxID=48021 RepID=A0ACB8T598_9AGAM|nr:hypothetical protein BV25DRAFT_1837564 [Artomyces pyxidatus]
MSLSTSKGSYAWPSTLKGVHYGPGCVSTVLPKLLSTIGGSRALVVTGRTLFTKTTVVKTVEDILRSNNTYGGTFHDIGEHAPIAGIHAGMQAFKDASADCAAGFTNEEGSKVGVVSSELTPAGIILDADLTLPTPERLWLSTGSLMVLVMERRMAFPTGSHR